MRLTVRRILPALLCSFAAAQTVPTTFDLGTLPTTFPPATVGAPYDFTLGEFFNIPPVDGITFTFAVTPPSNLPAGITLSANGRFSGTPQAPGTTALSIPGRWVFTDGRLTFTFTFTFTGSLVVSGTPGGLRLDTGGLAFTFSQGATAASTQSIRISNRGTPARSISAEASTSSGGAWLSASGGSAGAFSSATIPVTANPARLPAGVYAGSVRLTSPGGANNATDTFDVPVVMSIAAAQQTLTLSQSGFTFLLEEGSTASLTRSFQVLNNGSGNVQFTATASTLAGGNWLRISTASGQASSASPANIDVTINATGLRTGQYHGQIEVASSAVNATRTVNVVLNVDRAAGLLAPVVSPTGVVFVVGRTAPPAQNVTVTNVSSAPLPVSLSTTFERGQGWFTARGPSTPIAPGQTVTIPVTREPARLAPGVYRGELALRFGNGTISRVAVVNIVLPTAANPAIFERTNNQAEGCTPTSIVPVFTNLGAGFAAVAAWPSALELLVVDDCGDPMSSGAVSVAFTNGDPPVALSHLGAGKWTGTWQPKAGSQNVVVTASAISGDTPPLTGTGQLGGSLRANTGTPVISSGGVLSAASYARQAPVPNGGYISIFGEQLGAGVSVAQSLPLATSLGGTQVVMGGRRLPLQVVSDGQINAIVPFDLPANTPAQVVIQRGTSYSMPEQVVIAAAQPAVFTKDQSGRGEGIIVKADGSLVSASNPAAAGDVLVIYCTGLGAVTPPVTAGSAAPLDVISRTVDPVTVAIGGREAPVAFAGVTPGFAGLYQINVTVPAGTSANAATPVVVTASGQTGPPVTIATR